MWKGWKSNRNSKAVAIVSLQRGAGRCGTVCAAIPHRINVLKDPGHLHPWNGDIMSAARSRTNVPKPRPGGTTQMTAFPSLRNASAYSLKTQNLQKFIQWEQEIPGWGNADISGQDHRGNAWRLIIWSSGMIPKQSFAVLKSSSKSQLRLLLLGLVIENPMVPTTFS